MGKTFGPMALQPYRQEDGMTSGQVEQVVKKVVSELAMVRAQNTLLTVFLDRLDGFSREQFEREFTSFWESQGGMLSRKYWEELEKDLPRSS